MIDIMALLGHIWWMIINIPPGPRHSDIGKTNLLLRFIIVEMGNNGRIFRKIMFEIIESNKKYRPVLK